MSNGTSRKRQQVSRMGPQLWRMRWYLAVPTAVLGGLALDAATPSLEWWWAGLCGALLVLLSIWQQRAVAGLLLGILAGGAFWLPHISWLTLYLGPIPWLALSTVMIAWFGLFGLCLSFATRGLARLRVPPWVLVVLQSLAAAGLWVSREQVQSTWPYGGFAWGRLAHTQADGPLVALVSWLGFSGLSGLLALACAIPVAIYACSRSTRAGAMPSLAMRSSLVAFIAVAVSLSLLALVPVAPLQQFDTLRVAAVQGNSKSGIFDDRENGDVIRGHLEATSAMLDNLEARGESVDVIVWPENSAEFALTESLTRSSAVSRLAARADAPIVVGTILANDDGTYSNSSLVFDADGDTGVRYDKRRPVPFAEYMPNRAFFRALVPELVDLVQLDYAAGTRSAVLPVDGIAAGIAICFDIIFDDHALAMMGDDAEIIFAQTNNADFGRTDESAQQLQIARLRAVETGRALVNISTVGTSAIIAPDGRSLASIEPFTQDAMIAEVPLVRGQTPALQFGAVIAGAWIALGLGGVVLGLIGLRAERRESSAASGETIADPHVQ